MEQFVKYYIRKLRAWPILDVPIVAQLCYRLHEELSLVCASGFDDDKHKYPHII